ncbi:MAG: AAA family ATPase [Planctomycetes bacterium]|nr:AAA family ATPase [Planctomycetota bacterium]
MAAAEKSKELLATLEKYGTVLNGPAREGTVPRAFERDREVESVLARLNQPVNRSLILLGPSGSGKTAIVQEAVHRLNDRPGEPLLVLETSTGMMLSETRFLGEWQTRAHALVEAARRPARVVLYFTDIYDLLGAGTHNKSDESIGSFFRPFIEKGDIALVGECTPDLFRRGVDRFPAFRRLFHVLKVEEPPAPSVRKILDLVAVRRVQEALERDKLQLDLGERVLERVLDLSRGNFPGQVYPGKAIQLLDQVLSLHRDASQAPAAGPPAPEPRNNNHGAARDGAQVGAFDRRPIVVNPEDVVTALERSTGMPARLLDDTRALDLKEVQTFFEDRVLGQPEAIRAVLDIITLIKAGVNDPSKPIGVFFFVGPTGVGKTELARALAEFIFGSADRLVRIDLSEYKDFNAFEKLIGNPQAHPSNPLQHGTLTSKIREQPFSVVLLDEFEKAHANIFDLFLQVFDAGRLTDAQGHTTDFTQTIVIMTSNLGQEGAQEEPIGFLPESRLPTAEEVHHDMRRFFRPEFINRIDRVIVFRSLGLPEMRTIAQRELGKVLLRSGLIRRNVRTNVAPNVVDLLLKEGFSAQYGARPLKHAVERMVLLPIARELIHITPEESGTLLQISAADGQVRVKLLRDSASRKSEAVTRGIVLVDAAGRKKRRLGVPEVLERAGGFRERITALEKTCERDRLGERKAELVKKTSAITFWDQPKAAREVLGEIHRIEQLLGALDRIRKRVDDLAAMAEGVRRSTDPHGRAQLAERFLSVENHLELVSYSVQCRGPLQSCDAFVVVTAVGEPSAVQDDLAYMVSEMYARWAVSKGFSVTWIHEELLPGEKFTQQAVLLVEGVSVYGVLEGEVGLHEFARGKSGASGSRKLEYVSVDLLPLLEPKAGEFKPSDLLVERKKATGKGKRMKALRSRLTITHRGSGIRVEAQSEKPAEDLEPVALELLRARLHMSATPAVGEGPRPEQDRVVRKYSLSPSPLVRDVETGQSTGSLSEVLAGGIDDFLHARLARQLGGGGASGVGGAGSGATPPGGGRPGEANAK